MWSKCTWWVFFKELTKNSQYGSISLQTLKELTKYPPGTFWSHGGYFLNKPSKKSCRVAQAHYECIVRWFLKETEGFFHKVSAGYFLMWIVKGIKGFACNSTNIYPLGSRWVLSKCTHLNGRRVPGWVLCKNTQHVPSGYLGGQSVGKLQKWSKWTQWVNQDHPWRVLWWVLFENTQHVPSGYLTGRIGGELQKWSKWAWWVHAGYFVSEPTMYSPRTQWVNRGLPPVTAVYLIALSSGMFLILFSPRSYKPLSINSIKDRSIQGSPTTPCQI